MRPSEQQLAANDNRGGGQGGLGDSSPATPRPEVLGLSLAPLDEAARRRISPEAGVRGLVIAGVDAASDAAQKGVRKDDILVRAGDRDVNAAADLSSVVDVAKKAGRQSVLVGIYRGGRTIFLPLKVSG